MESIVRDARRRGIKGFMGFTWEKFFEL